MTLEERKEMCEAYHGTWVHSYRKGNVEVAGYCRYTRDTAYRKNKNEDFLKEHNLPFVPPSSKYAWDYREEKFRWKR